MTPLDEEIASLTERLLPLLCKRAIRHYSIFSRGAVYISVGDWRCEIKANGESPAEALAKLDEVLVADRFLETMY
jgi:hypothetical protein